MRSFAKAVTDITRNLVDKFEKAADAAVKSSYDNMADAERAFKDFEDACTSAQKTSVDGAYGELKEHLTRWMREEGMSKAEAEKWFESKWTDVKGLGDKIRNAAPKAKAAGKFVWLKVLGAIAAVPVILLGLKLGTQAPRKDEIRRANDQQDEARIYAQMQMIEASEEQFNQLRQMMSDVEVPPASPAPMPMAVAAVAPEPVQVEVATPSGNEEYTSTVGRVWQAVPQARHEIEQEAMHLDHGYDHPDPNSCVATDCLNQHSNQSFHKEFTVDSPIGSATFKY